VHLPACLSVVACDAVFAISVHITHARTSGMRRETRQLIELQGSSMLPFRTARDDVCPSLLSQSGIRGTARWVLWEFWPRLFAQKWLN